MAQKLPGSNDKILLVYQQQLLVTEDNTQSLTWVTLTEFVAMFGQTAVSTHQFLSIHCDRQCTYYAVDIIETTDDNSWVAVRSLLDTISTSDYSLVSRGLQLVTWSQQHRFCGQCGSATHYHKTENAFQCQNCSLFYYPRISPCMMCLIIKGEYCLLARHQHHPQGLYSTLAGFVEAGESIEQTLHREVMEEVGLTVTNVDYFSSQSWPFPHQLMAGYFAEYLSGDIVIEEEEIVDAQWFHYSQLPDIPPLETLSGQLIQSFVSRYK